MSRGSASYNLTAAALGMLILFAATLATAVIIPGEWFARFDLTVVPSESGPEVVVQTRRVTLDRSFVASWHAKVERITSDGRYEVCSGGGTSTYQAPATAFRAPVWQWVGDEGCSQKMRAGETYVLAASWRFNVLGIIPQVTFATSAPFVAR